VLPQVGRNLDLMDRPDGEGPQQHQCTNVPATRNTWPPEVLNARPFWPQRTSRPMLPLTLLMVVESIKASVVKLNDCKVTTLEPNDFSLQSCRPAGRSALGWY
jgi:hypothetical protein